MRPLLALVLLLAALPAVAEEPHGCDKLAWNLDTERALIAKAEAPPDGPLDRNLGTAIVAKLVPLADAKLVMPPERTPKKASSFAAILQFAEAAAAASYHVTLSAPAWIDVVQDGHYVKSGAFTGVLDCPGARKSVTFALGAAPFALQLSDVATGSIALVITPAN